MVLKYVLAFMLTFTLALSAHATEKPVLNIYTYDSFAADWGPAPKLKEMFEETCNCTLNWIAGNSSIASLRKIQLDGDESEADILLGLDSSIVSEALNTGLFIEHGLDLAQTNIPGGWNSNHFVAFDYGIFAFVYNKTKLASPPLSFQDIVDNQENLKIVIQDPRSSTPGLGLVLWLKAAYGDNAAGVWAKLVPHVLTVTKGWSQSYSLFLKGEADMVLSYTTSPAYHLIAEDDDSFAAAPFEEGHYAQIEVAGILKNSPNPILAKKFLAWLISPEAQSVLPTTNWMYPVADIYLPDGFDSLFKPEKILLLDNEQVQNMTSTWVEEMLGAFK